MKIRKFIKPLERLSRRLNSRLVLIYLAIIQVLLLLFFYFNWPATNLTLFVPKEEESAWQSLITDFNNQNSKIRINLRTRTNLAGDITYRLKEDFVRDCQTGKSLYDLVYTDVIWLPELAEKECLVNLYQWTSKPALEADGFLANAIASSEYKSKLYRMPFRSDIGLLYYRKKLLGNSQPPETFAQLKSLAQSQKNENVYLWQGWRYEGLVANFVEVLASYNGTWIERKSNTFSVGLNEQPAIDAVNFLLDTIRDNISSPEVILYSEKESLETFNNDKDTVFLRQWPNAWKQLEDASNIGVQVLSRSCDGSWGLAIAATSEHPQEAWTALQYFTSQAAQKKFILEKGYLPTRESLFDDEDIIAEYNYFPSLKEAVKTSISRPPIPQYDQASFILQKYLSKLITKAALGQPVDDNQIKLVMEQAACETRKLLGLESQQDCANRNTA